MKNFKITQLCALFLLILFSPLFLILSLLVLLDLGWPVFFIQQRSGLKGIPFNMYKFRTMSNSPSDFMSLERMIESDAKRITKFGFFLRSSSLDELPELFNVFKGDMTFVGPRPLLTDYLSLYSVEQRIRLNVLPGLTGWAQINGRNSLTWDEKLSMDVWYVKHKSLILDIYILLKTFVVVLSRRGVSMQGQATNIPFRGNDTIDFKE